MGRYVEVYIDDADLDVDIHDIVSDYSDAEWLWFVRKFNKQLGRDAASDITALGMADPAVRLSAITWLRENGWSVEPK